MIAPGIRWAESSAGPSIQVRTSLGGVGLYVRSHGLPRTVYKEDGEVQIYW